MAAGASAEILIWLNVLVFQVLTASMAVFQAVMARNLCLAISNRYHFSMRRESSSRPHAGSSARPSLAWVAHAAGQLLLLRQLFLLRDGLIGR